MYDDDVCNKNRIRYCEQVKIAQDVVIAIHKRIRKQNGVILITLIPIILLHCLTFVSSMGGWMGVTIMALSRKDTVLARIAKFSQYEHNYCIFWQKSLTVY